MNGYHIILYLLLIINMCAFGQLPELAKSFIGHTQTIMALAESNKGKFLLSGSDDALAYLWNDQGKIILTMNDHLRSVNDVAFSPDDQRFVTAGSDRTFIIWNIDGTKIKTVIADKIYVKTVVYSNDGMYILSGGGDNIAKLWSADGKFVLTASEDATAKLWSLDGTLMVTFGANGKVNYTSATFSKNGNFVILSSKNNAINFWYLPKKKTQ